MQISRRKLLVFAGAAALLPQGRTGASVLAIPTVDHLDLTVLIDSTTAVFGAAIDTPQIKTVPPPVTRDYTRAFAGQWGYSLLARSTIGAATRSTLIDFGYTPEALLNNMGLLGIDAAELDAMVLSHGHYDHFGGLGGLLATGRVRRGTPFFVGDEETFCERVRGITPDGAPFGAIDRQALLRAGIVPVISGNPQIVATQGFTTGRIPFVSSERPRVPTGMFPGRGCNRALLDPAKRDSAFVVDDAVHELGTAFNLAGRGLVVIGSCSHRGIINTVRQAQAVAGVRKVHAIVGGFHLVAPQTREQALETVALMREIDPDIIIPGHCSGETFIAAAQAALPGKVTRSIVGTRYLFGQA